VASLTSSRGNHDDAFVDQELASDDVEATNTVDAPDRVVPVTLRGVTIDTGIVTADLPRI
jgi:alpha-L-arabinofuranosidase